MTITQFFGSKSNLWPDIGACMDLCIYHSKVVNNFLQEIFHGRNENNVYIFEGFVSLPHLTWGLFDLLAD